MLQCNILLKSKKNSYLHENIYLFHKTSGNRFRVIKSSACKPRLSILISPNLE